MTTAATEPPRIPWTRIVPLPQRATFPHVAGGVYLDAASGTDVTETQWTDGLVTVSGGIRMLVSGRTNGTPDAVGCIVRTNLFKAKSGWRWAEPPTDGPHRTDALVAVETGGRHHYALSVLFSSGVRLARRPDARREPRLRPTANGWLRIGTEIGTIVVRSGRTHGVSDVVEICRPEPTMPQMV